jgi:hypothetical protein
MEGGAVGQIFERAHPGTIPAMFGLKITFKSSPLKPLNQMKPNLAGMVPGWVTLKIVSVSAVLYPKWPPLLKIENSSKGQRKISNKNPEHMLDYSLSCSCS